MARITWQDSFSVRHAELDEQHRQWIAIINELHEVLMHEGVAQLLSATSRILAKMEAYARYHFAYEEELMLRQGYADFSQHQQLHQEFLGVLARYRQRLDSDELLLNSELMRILTSWLEEHILNADQGYAPLMGSLDSLPVGDESDCRRCRPHAA